MSGFLPLAEIKSRVRALARAVDAPESCLPTFDSRQDGLFVESDAAYHLAYVEPTSGMVFYNSEEPPVRLSAC